MTFSDFQETNARVVQDILRNQHLVITDKEGAAPGFIGKFNGTGLLRLGVDARRPIVVHGGLSNCLVYLVLLITDYPRSHAPPP